MPRTATTADVFNAIAEGGRRELLDALGDGEASVNDLVARVRSSGRGMTQPQVSKHLGVLREVGAVRVRVDGRHHYYRIFGPALQPIHEWVARFEQTWNDRLDRLDDLVATMKENEPE